MAGVGGAAAAPALDAAQILAIAATVIAATPAFQPSVETFSKNLFAKEINLTAKAGKELFNQRTKPLPMDKRILVTIGNAKKVLSITKDQASRYGWGPLILHILNAANTDPDVKELNMITQYGSLTLDNLKREAN
eukprot:1841290-Ditylum_brightwellii.AAC.1